ncbi:alpha/beta hydrolase [Bradyrhizobium sp.]|uniref:alpha/beta hydrolase n=1 Tax=Bradyrhizobium sp. TaxID=376 RepID=UPI001EC6E990|nr:alpha/beta hydrolase [Bradyrhizobium sp.]MBV8922012.1 alpha/beta hydrolase [Bradyrhizobium sp.]MBV9980909.1 alpha/beta hydrolase [Bradyrhizobium sp.]
MSLRAELARLGLRVFLKRRGRQFDVEAWRARMRAMAPLVPRPPRRSRSIDMKTGAIRVQRVATDKSRADRHVLYLHGGAYMAGSPAHYRHFSWRIADALHANIWMLAYRLAPEHPYPAALDDASEAYAHLADTAGDYSRLFVMGDSAGGGLALALLLRLRDEGRRLPTAAVAISPWTDLALTGASLKLNADADPMLTTEPLPELAELYLAGLNPRSPYASPLYGDTTSLPPVLIQVGSDEILRDDAVRMAEKLIRDNPKSRLEVWPRMPHCWHLLAPVVPEARQAIQEIAAFVAAIEAG